MVRYWAHRYFPEPSLDYGYALLSSRYGIINAMHDTVARHIHSPSIVHGLDQQKPEKQVRYKTGVLKIKFIDCGLSILGSISSQLMNIDNQPSSPCLSYGYKMFIIRDGCRWTLQLSILNLHYCREAEAFQLHEWAWDYGWGYLCSFQPLPVKPTIAIYRVEKQWFHRICECLLIYG